MPNSSQSPGPSILSISFLGTLVCILLFLIILLVVYIPNRPLPVDQAIVKARIERLSKLHAHEQEVTTSYGWVDPEAGSVHIPVERAMELTVNKLQAEQKASL